MEAITQNPKAVPFVTQMPVYTGASVPAVGEALELTVRFNKPVVVTGSPSLRLAIRVGSSGEVRYATYSGGSGSDTLTFRWDPVDVGGITGFEVTQIDQSSGRIASADGTQTAESFVPNSTFTMPSYSIAVSPSVIDYTNQNSVILNVANYGSGNMAVVSLNGNALPAVPAAASIPLDVSSLPDGVITVTYYEIENTQTLLSVSTTLTKNTSDQAPPTVTMNAITTPSANTTQTLTGTVSDALNASPTVEVRLSPGTIVQAATVTGTTWTATVSGLTDATYTVVARASDGINTSDTSPQTLVINTAAPSATLSTIAGSVYTGAQILTNDATPTLAGTATGGGSATVSQVDISLDGGATWSPATGTANWTYTPSANLTDIIYSVQVRVTNSVGTQSTTPFASAMRVDSAAPTITDVTAPADATYGSGQNLDFVATMSEATTVNTTSGTPRIALTIGSTTQYATYLSGSGTTSLTFRYITQSGDNDTDGIAVMTPSSVQLNGGTLRDSASNAATLTFTPPTTTGVLVDTSAPTGTVTPRSTIDTTPALSGTLGETGLTVTVIVNGQGPYTAAVSGTTWTLADNTITPALAVGTYNVILTITDAAGNVGNYSTNNALTIFVATGGTITPINVGGIDYKVHTFTSNGTFTVTGGTLTIQAVAIGGGGGGAVGDGYNFGSGGAGGGLAYGNAITVTAESLTVVVGAGGAAVGGTNNTNGNNGGTSTLGRGATILLSGGGGQGGVYAAFATGGTSGGTERTSGGVGGSGGQGWWTAGGGGAGGYSGDGGAGQRAGTTSTAGVAGSGGGGGSGSAGDAAGQGGGGTGIFGQGSNGVANGGGGSGGGNGVVGVNGGVGGSGGAYGGGGGGKAMASHGLTGAGGPGVVAIRYPI
jgi:hypothetical protein